MRHRPEHDDQPDSDDPAFVISSNATVSFLSTLYRRIAGFWIAATVGATAMMADTADLGIRISDQPGSVVVGNRIELSIVVLPKTAFAECCRLWKP